MSYKINKKCKICGKEFIARTDCKSRKQIFCSSKCYGKSIAKFKKCLNCRIEFYNWQNKYFCSRECSNKFKIGKKLSIEHKKSLSKAKIGKPIKHFIENKDNIKIKISKALKGKKQPWNQGNKHHHWEGGRNRRWARILAKKYMNFVCQECGEIKDLCVHHIDENWKNNKLNNLKVLCRKCHNRLHAIKQGFGKNN